ncbi:hypothetical protein BpHYR1_026326 [Brachionus plicatilis]|uniref:RNA-directed DNA polymerase from mobile element jockey-like n=1 Tax=Brachionus plicatilis TaxID=10195 RepID=A0A3M7QSB2_BRAPC|nr:hypothetical protein BpHYR1_026326 [Brachionus plicatilis]
MRYLGYEFSSDNKDEHHLKKRKLKANAALAKLNLLEINTDRPNPHMKGQLFKVFIRPVLYYGLENVFIQKITLNLIKRIDGNLLKRIFALPTRCHYTDLQIALDIKPVSEVVKKMKLEFYLRLTGNTYTRDLLLETSGELCRDDLLSEIINHIDEVDDPIVQCQTTTIEKIKAINYVMDVNSKTRKLGNENVAIIKKNIFANKNRCNITNELFNILKF